MSHFTGDPDGEADRWESREREKAVYSVEHTHNNTYTLIHTITYMQNHNTLTHIIHTITHIHNHKYNHTHTHTHTFETREHGLPLMFFSTHLLFCTVSARVPLHRQQEEIQVLLPPAKEMLKTPFLGDKLAPLVRASLQTHVDRKLTFRVLILEKAEEFDLVLDALKGLDFQLVVHDLHWVFDELKSHTHRHRHGHRHTYTHIKMFK